VFGLINRVRTLFYIRYDCQYDSEKLLAIMVPHRFSPEKPHNPAKSIRPKRVILTHFA